MNSLKLRTVFLFQELWIGGSSVTLRQILTMGWAIYVCIYLVIYTKLLIFTTCLNTCQNEILCCWNQYSFNGVLCSLLSVCHFPDRIYINAERCCNNTPLSWWIKMKVEGTCSEIKQHKGISFNTRFKNMIIIAIQTFSLSASLQKDQCTLHTPNCTNANIMSNHVCLLAGPSISSCALWLAFNPGDFGHFSDIYSFIYLQSSYLHKYSADRQGKKQQP